MARALLYTFQVPPLRPNHYHHPAATSPLPSCCLNHPNPTTVHTTNTLKPLFYTAPTNTTSAASTIIRTMVKSWWYHDDTMLLPWWYHGDTMVIPWWYHGDTIVIPWCYHNADTMMIFSDEGKWKLHWYFVTWKKEDVPRLAFSKAFLLSKHMALLVVYIPLECPWLRGHWGARNNPLLLVLPGFFWGCWCCCFFYHVEMKNRIECFNGLTEICLENHFKTMFLSLKLFSNKEYCGKEFLTFPTLDLAFKLKREPTCHCQRLSYFQEL